MRAYLYREQVYEHGDYATVSVFPVFPAPRRRKGRYRPTSDTQQALNAFNAAERLGRQLDEHMRDGGVHAVLTYDDAHLPQTRAQAVRDWKNFKRRLERYYARYGLGELKAAAVIHGDAGGARLHIHTVINAVLGKFEIMEIWRNGLVTKADELYFGPYGLRGLAKYMLDGMSWGRVMTTRNLTDVEPWERTGRISAADAGRLLENWDDKSAYEGRLPGYKVAAVKPFYNTFNRHTYVRIYLYKQTRGVGDAAPYGANRRT